MNARLIVPLISRPLKVCALATLMFLPNLVLAETTVPVAKFDGSINSVVDGSSTQLPGYLNIEKVEGRNYVLQVWRLNREGTPIRLLQGTLEKHTESLIWQVPGADPIRLQKAGTCWQNHEEEAKTIRLCHDNNEISFEYHGVSQAAPAILLFHGDTARTVAARPMVLSEIPIFAASNNFDARTRMMILRQAQLQTKLSYRNLLPHFTMGTIVNGATAGSGLGALAMVGDLAPFLFPSRWILASEHKSLQAAQTWSLTAYRLDAASVTEGLALVYLRDRAVLRIIQEQIDSITQIQNIVQQKENLGLVGKGSADNLRSLILGIKQDQVGLAKVNSDEKNQLAYAMGLVDPRQLGEVKDDSILKITALSSQEEHSYSDSSVARSPEVKVVEGLIDAARKSARGRYFNWMDPYADPQGGIGFGTGAYLDIGKAKVSEMEVHREQVLASVEQKVENLLNEHGLSIEGYNAADENCKIQKRRADRYIKAIETEVNFDDAVLVAALKDYASAKVQLVMSEYAYKAVANGLRRISVGGEYDKIYRNQGR